MEGISGTAPGLRGRLGPRARPRRAVVRGGRAPHRVRFLPRRRVHLRRRNPHFPSLVKGGTTYRFFLDHLGSVRLVVDAATGMVAQRIDYDEFGVVLSDSNPGLQPFGFAGGLYDHRTGLVRFGARDYDAEVGRWTAKDSVLFDGDGPNLYVYVRGDPVNLVDRSGRKAMSTLADCKACLGEANRIYEQCLKRCPVCSDSLTSCEKICLRIENRYIEEVCIANGVGPCGN